MKYQTIAVGLAALALSACGQQPKSGHKASTATGQATQIYSGQGKVTAVAGDQVTISHGPIQGIGWPAMTMTFTAPAGMSDGIKAGDGVSFAFRQQGGAYVLTSLQKH